MKNAIRIWVKGSQEQGRAAIAEHLGAGVAKFITVSMVTSDTVWDVPATLRKKVVAWFCEPPHEGPYPVGTLLFYSEGK